MKRQINTLKFVTLRGRNNYITITVSRYALKTAKLISRKEYHWYSVFSAQRLNYIVNRYKPAIRLDNLPIVLFMFKPEF